MKQTLVAQGRIDTPLGALTLAATARGLALAWFDGQAHRTDEVAAPLQPDNEVLRQAKREFDEYFAGRRREFSVPLDPAGTDFQQRVWRALLQIPMGRLGTYGDIARQLGLPAAARAAVGRSCSQIQAISAPQSGEVALKIDISPVLSTSAASA